MPALHSRLWVRPAQKSAEPVRQPRCDRSAFRPAFPKPATAMAEVRRLQRQVQPQSAFHRFLRPQVADQPLQPLPCRPQDGVPRRKSIAEAAPLRRSMRVPDRDATLKTQPKAAQAVPNVLRAEDRETGLRPSRE